VVFAKDGERCLSCISELDPRALARTQMTEERRSGDDEIYGVDRAALDTGGPSVVSVNGVVASLAVTEFMAWRTGLRELPQLPRRPWHGRSPDRSPTRLLRLLHDVVGSERRLAALLSEGRSDRCTGSSPDRATLV
jgi:hypothetical protein